MFFNVSFEILRETLKNMGRPGYEARVCNWHSSPLLAFWHIEVTMRHQIAGDEQAANHTNRSLLQLY